MGKWIEITQRKTRLEIGLNLTIYLRQTPGNQYFEPLDQKRDLAAVAFLARGKNSNAPRAQGFIVADKSRDR